MMETTMFRYCVTCFANFLIGLKVCPSLRKVGSKEDLRSDRKEFEMLCPICNKHVDTSTEYIEIEKPQVAHYHWSCWIASGRR